MVCRYLLCASLVAVGCGGASEPDPVSDDTSTAGSETPPEPTGPPPEAVAEVRGLVAALSLGPTAEAATRLREAGYRTTEVAQVGAACLHLVEAFVAGSYEAFDLDAQCFTRVDTLRGTHGVEEAPDTSGFRQLVAASRSERQANLPPLPPGFATETDERAFEGELVDGDPTRENQAAYDDHALELTAGWTITVDMTSPTFDTYIVLTGPDGQSIAEDDDGGEGLNSRLSHRVVTPGTYTVRATAFSPTGRGSYRVTVALAQH